MKNQVEITVEAICEAFDKYRNFICTPKTKQYRVGDVIDENKSVKWNREEIQRLNDLRDEKVKLLKKQKQELYEVFKDMVCKYIMQETKVDKARSIKIFNFLEKNYSLKHEDWFNHYLLYELFEVFYK